MKNRGYVSSGDMSKPLSSRISLKTDTLLSILSDEKPEREKVLEALMVKTTLTFLTTNFSLLYKHLNHLTTKVFCNGRNNDIAL